ncbi:hypothetical protein GCM10010399_55220 [Dactylosporangium fulvum]|uniref:Uncharacterized protein n=1 Tax=Dactylosporangium fulvum TaxID=53359 RepID=A0ABY5VZA4_9ACTN|nr:hypothetical protein [Dactylosporangium fulvum]UWP83107.1 hypothetical protein Dfulv_02015 [Dactylosporangium fulvum]
MHDDEEMLRRLRVDDLPPSMVDLNRAMRAGRRRERMGAVVAGGLAAVLALGTVVVVAATTGKNTAAPWPGAGPEGSRSPEPAPPLGNCTIDEAPVASQSRMIKIVANRSGQVFVMQDPLKSGNLLRWMDGRQERIDGVPTGDGYGTAAAVNGSGAFVGASGYKPAWVYRDGTFTVLPLPPDVSAMSMVGINERGDLIGTAFYWDGRDDTRAVLWPASQQGTPVLLATPAGWSSEAMDIADDGTVVGYLSHRTDNGPVDITPMAWGLDGSARRLPVPAGWTPARAGKRGPYPIAIAGDWVVGAGARWNLRTGTAEVVEGLMPMKVDKYGRLFGNVPLSVPDNGSTSGRPAVWVNGDVQPLPIYPDRPEGTLFSVSLDGRRITGTSYVTSGAFGTATWTCGR